MKLDTRFKLFRKDYNSIRDDNKTIDQIWNKKNIPLEDRIVICINNKYYDNLKEITTEELNDLDFFLRILAILKLHFILFILFTFFIHIRIKASEGINISSFATRYLSISSFSKLGIKE